MKNKILFIVFLSIIFILTYILLFKINDNDLIILTANTQINAYIQPSSKDVVFIIPKGMTCSAGSQISKKVFSYRKVLCPISVNGFSVGYIITTIDNTYTATSEHRKLNC